MLQQPEFWVAVAFLIFIGIVVKAGAVKAMLANLDNRGKRIAAELEDARVLHDEAQRVLAEYQRRRSDAVAEAQEIVRAAQAEAERLAQDAQIKLADFVARRTKMAEEKIALAESRAAADVRAAAADAAVKAAEIVLRQHVASGGSDRLVEQGLGELRAKLN